MLDIGCNGGFYAIEMKRRGAARVLGVDWDETYLTQARFAGLCRFAPSGHGRPLPTHRGPKTWGRRPHGRRQRRGRTGRHRHTVGPFLPQHGGLG